MKMEGLEFPEALRHLGKRVGVEVKRFNSKESNERQRLIGINDLAARFYRKVLLDTPGAASARGYLENRGVTPVLQERFGIGFALENWDALAQFLAKKGYRDMECEKAGLLLRKKSGSGMIDRFRGRIMIPLRDRHGDVVGFTGRIMPGADEKSGAKYMNTPETPIYHKGSLLFGLDVAKQAIKQAGNVIIVEGNLDVVASHKAGIENVVASSGTALTEDQLGLLKRYTKTIVFSFDGDAAGFAAAQKGIRLARSLEFDVRVAVIPPEFGKDPDDVVQKDPELWKQAVEQTMPIMQYFIERATQGKDLRQVDDKRAVGAFLLPEIAQIADVVEREHWLQVVADLLKIDIGALRSAIGRTTVHREPKQREAPQKPRIKQTALTKEAQIAELLIGLIVQTDTVRERLISAIDVELIVSESLRLLYKQAQETYNSSQSDQTQKSFFRQLRETLETTDQEVLIKLLDKIVLEAEQFVADTPANKVLDQSKSLLQTLEDSAVHVRRRAIEGELRQAERAGDTEAVTRLLREFNDLQ
jgi:DNA primase